MYIYIYMAACQSGFLKKVPPKLARTSYPCVIPLSRPLSSSPLSRPCVIPLVTPLRHTLVIPFSCIRVIILGGRFAVILVARVGRVLRPQYISQATRDFHG